MIHILMQYQECLHKAWYYAAGIKQYFLTCSLSQYFRREAGIGPVHAMCLHISS